MSVYLECQKMNYSYSWWINMDSKFVSRNVDSRNLSFMYLKCNIRHKLGNTFYNAI